MTKTNISATMPRLQLMQPCLLKPVPKKSEAWKPELSTALGGYWIGLDPNPNPIRTILRMIEENHGKSNVPQFGKSNVNGKSNVYGKSILLDESAEERLKPGQKSQFQDKEIKVIPLDEIDMSKLVEIPESDK